MLTESAKTVLECLPLVQSSEAVLLLSNHLQSVASNTEVLWEKKNVLCNNKKKKSRDYNITYKIRNQNIQKRTRI